MARKNYQYWLNLLPPPIKEQAKRAATVSGHANTLSDSIFEAIHWEASKQGGDYWWEIYLRILFLEMEHYERNEV